MLKNNLIVLRNIYGYSQEKISEKIGVSRQAYAKWETGETVPDILKCQKIARIYNVPIDSLLAENNVEGIGSIPPAPHGKNIWGVVMVGERGQIVIPKEVRKKYSLENGTRLIILSDEDGIALVPADNFEKKMREIMQYASVNLDK